MLVYPRGGCGNTACCLFAYLLVCIFQAGLEPAFGGTGALLFSQKKLFTGWVFGVSEFCFFLVFLFCQVGLQYLSKIFYLQSSRCLFPRSSHHLESPFLQFFQQVSFFHFHT
jgi:hypothetical protein